MPTIGGFLKSKQRTKDLKFQATDVDWTYGDGALVEGPGEALLLAMGGRPVALDELSGEGVATLTERVKG